jgi:hypothetical protein
MKLVINTLLICTTYLPMEPNLHGLRCLLIPSHLHSSKRHNYHVQLGHLSIKILLWLIATAFHFVFFQLHVFIVMTKCKRCESYKSNFDSSQSDIYPFFVNGNMFSEFLTLINYISPMENVYPYSKKQGLILVAFC